MEPCDYCGRVDCDGDCLVLEPVTHWPRDLNRPSWFNPGNIPLIELGGDDCEEQVNFGPAEEVIVCITADATLFYSALVHW